MVDNVGISDQMNHKQPTSARHLSVLVSTVFVLSDPPWTEGASVGIHILNGCFVFEKGRGKKKKRKAKSLAESFEFLTKTESGLLL